MDTTPRSEEQPTRTGINWLGILGIIALVILIFVVIWAIMVWNQAKDNPLIVSLMRMEPALAEMQDLTQAQIEQQGAYLEAELLAKDPDGYVDRFVVVEGSVSAEESMNVNSAIASNLFTDSEYKAFVLDDAVVLVDITGEAPELKDGTAIKGFGKVFVVRMRDIWELPIIGKDLKTEFGDIEGMANKAIFVISKGIEITYVPEDIEPEPLPGELTDEMIEGGAPAEGEMPVADEAAEEEAAPEEAAEEEAAEEGEPEGEA